MLSRSNARGEVYICVDEELELRRPVTMVEGEKYTMAGKTPIVRTTRGRIESETADGRGERARRVRTTGAQLGTAEHHKARRGNVDDAKSVGVASVSRRDRWGLGVVYVYPPHLENQFIDNPTRMSSSEEVAALVRDVS